MNKTQIIARIDLLMAVFHWTIEHNIGLNAGQRICITMERVALLRCLEAIRANPYLTPLPKYVLPPALNEKVVHIYRNTIK